MSDPWCVDVLATTAAGTPCMRRVRDVHGEQVLAYTERLPNGHTVWGSTLRQIRLRLGWSQDEIGRLIGVSKRTITRWESGGTPPPQRRAQHAWGTILRTLDR